MILVDSPRELELLKTFFIAALNVDRGMASGHLYEANKNIHLLLEEPGTRMQTSTVIEILERCSLRYSILVEARVYNQKGSIKHFFKMTADMYRQLQPQTKLYLDFGCIKQSHFDSDRNDGKSASIAVMADNIVGIVEELRSTNGLAVATSPQFAMGCVVGGKTFAVADLVELPPYADSSTGGLVKTVFYSTIKPLLFQLLSKIEPYKTTDLGKMVTKFVQQIEALIEQLQPDGCVHTLHSNTRVETSHHVSVRVGQHGSLDRLQLMVYLVKTFVLHEPNAYGDAELNLPATIRAALGVHRSQFSIDGVQQELFVVKKVDISPWLVRLKVAVELVKPHIYHDPKWKPPAALLVLFARAVATSGVSNHWVNKMLAVSHLDDNTLVSILRMGAALAKNQQNAQLQIGLPPVAETCFLQTSFPWRSMQEKLEGLKAFMPGNGTGEAQAKVKEKIVDFLERRHHLRTSRELLEWLLVSVHFAPTGRRRAQAQRVTCFKARGGHIYLSARNTAMGQVEILENIITQCGSPSNIAAAVEFVKMKPR